MTWEEKEQLGEVKRELISRTVRKTDGIREQSDSELLSVIETTVREYWTEHYLSAEERAWLKRSIFNGLRGLDVLEELMEDPGVTEIMVNSADDIFVERDGRLYRTPVHFPNEQRLRDVIQKIAGGVNRVVNEANPIVDARLSDGSRVNIVLPPVALDGPCVTIRKFPEKRITMETLLSIGSISPEAAEFLKRLVRAGYNIFVSGGTGAGKTTFLNVLSDYIPPGERIVTIEDSAELQLGHIENLVRLEMRNANVEGRLAITMRDLIKTSLRMRPDRIIVGEVRDGAAVDMLQSLNTGHNGMSTGHANSPQDMLSRIEMMVLLSEEIPLAAVRKQMSSAIDIIIQLGRLRDRTRKVLSIVEVLDVRDGEIPVNPLFVFRETGEDENGRIIGALEPTGARLTRNQKLILAGESEAAAGGTTA